MVHSFSIAKTRTHLLVATHVNWYLPDPGKVVWDLGVTRDPRDQVRRPTKWGYTRLPVNPCYWQIVKTSMVDQAEDGRNEMDHKGSTRGCHSVVLDSYHWTQVPPCQGPCGGCRCITLPMLKDFTCRCSPERDISHSGYKALCQSGSSDGGRMVKSGSPYRRGGWKMVAELLDEADRVLR